MVICNGIPKSGTHALEKTVQLLGQQTELAHAPYSEKPAGKVINIFRNPRNIIVSWIRFTGRPVTQGFLVQEIGSYEGGPVGESFARYTPYLSDPDVLCVRFEALFTDGGATVAAIANYLGVPVLDDCYPNILGLTSTWSGKLSNWQDHWTPAVEAAWVDAGGIEVEAAWN